eukprot:gene3946-2809_t
MYKKALSSFFLKVHPDFFHFNSTYQRTNENAVAQLNELLGWAKEFKKGTCRPPPATKISFTFYRRVEDEEGSRPSRPDASDPSVATLSSTFELPSNFKPQFSNHSMVERSVNKFLRDLLRRAECIDSVSASLSAAEDTTTERLEERPLRRRPRYSRSEQRKDQQKRGADGAEEGQFHRTLLDEAAESFEGSLYASASPYYTPPPTLEELMDADQIYLATYLSPLQCAAALHTLREHLGTLQYNKWESMPLAIGHRFEVGGALPEPSAAAETAEADATHAPPRGFMIPWDFTPPQFLAFLQTNEVPLRLARTRLQERAEEMERRMAALSRSLEWDDVLISCSHSEASQALELLSRHEGLLAAHDVTKLTVELGSKYATRANGVLILDTAHLLRGGERALQEWLTAVGPKLQLQKELYRVSKHLLETTLYYVKETERVLELPGGIDVFDHNECTYAERLQWIKELFGEFRFLLGPKPVPMRDTSKAAAEEEPEPVMDLDWERKVLVLPLNFDGDAFLRYVELLQEDAKEKKRAALVAAHSAQRLKEDREREALHQLELQGGAPSYPEDETEGSSQQERGSPYPPPSAPQPPAMDALFPNADDLLTSRERLLMEREGVPRSQDSKSGANFPSFMAEYMTSSRSGDPDPLTVERPLHHAVHFNSDDEAADNLKWEGFYQEPYVDQVPTGDLDDLQHTFNLTNRRHREAAAKKLLTELQDSYGKSSRRFDYLKMGDVLEINNAKVQPKGFPILSRGTRASYPVSNNTNKLKLVPVRYLIPPNIPFHTPKNRKSSSVGRAIGSGMAYDQGNDQSQIPIFFRDDRAIASTVPTVEIRQQPHFHIHKRNLDTQSSSAGSQKRH